MAQKLVYTSSPKGLQPGAYGFCVVAATRGLSDRVASFLASTSGYRRVFSPESGQANLNPVSHTHMLVDNLGQTFRILSRVADAGLDYTNRTNKIASFLLLDRNELAPAGPAALFDVPDLFYSEWNQAPTWFEPSPIPNPHESPTTQCYQWDRVMGSPDWGAALAATVYSGAPVALVYAPGRNDDVNVLKLFQESIRLLPANMRWKATFSTYFTQAPLGAQCQWKAVLAGSPEEATMRANPRVVLFDLTRPGGAMPETGLASPNGAQLLNLARGVVSSPTPTVVPVPGGAPFGATAPPPPNALTGNAIPFAPQPQRGAAFPSAPTPWEGYAGPTYVGSDAPGVYATNGIEVPGGAKPINYGRDWKQPVGEEEDPFAKPKKGKKDNSGSSGSWSWTLFVSSAIIVSLVTCILMFCFVPGIKDGFKKFIDNANNIQNGAEPNGERPDNNAPEPEQRETIEEPQTDDEDPYVLEETIEKNDDTRSRLSNELVEQPTGGAGDPFPEEEVAGASEETTTKDVQSLLRDEWQEYVSSFIDSVDQGKLFSNKDFDDSDENNLTQCIGGDYMYGQKYNDKHGICILKDSIEDETEEEENGTTSSSPSSSSLSSLLDILEKSGSFQEGDSSEQTVSFRIAIDLIFKDDTAAKRVSGTEKWEKSNEGKILTWNLSKESQPINGVYESDALSLLGEGEESNEEGIATLVVGKDGWIAFVFEGGDVEALRDFFHDSTSMKISFFNGDEWEKTKVFQMVQPSSNQTTENEMDCIVDSDKIVYLPYLFSEEEKPSVALHRVIINSPNLVCNDQSIELKKVVLKKSNGNDDSEKIQISTDNDEEKKTTVLKCTLSQNTESTEDSLTQFQNSSGYSNQNDTFEVVYTIKTDLEKQQKSNEQGWLLGFSLKEVRTSPLLSKNIQDVLDESFIVLELELKWKENKKDEEKSVNVGKLKIPCKEYSLENNSSGAKNKNK